MDIRLQKDQDPADLVRALLLYNGWTQAELANRVGVLQGAVSSWLSGRKRPRAKHHRRLLDLTMPIPDPVGAFVKALAADPTVAEVHYADASAALYLSPYYQRLFGSAAQFLRFVRQESAIGLMDPQDLERLLQDDVLLRWTDIAPSGQPLHLLVQAVDLGTGPLVITRLAGQDDRGPAGLVSAQRYRLTGPN